jgi:hypothetical protein
MSVTNDPKPTPTVSISGFSFLRGRPPTVVEVPATTTVLELYPLFDQKLNTPYHTGIFTRQDDCHRGICSLYPNRSVTITMYGSLPDSQDESSRFLALPVTQFAPDRQVTWVIYRGLEPRNLESSKQPTDVVEGHKNKESE